MHDTYTSNPLRLVDALKRANDFVKFEAEDGEQYSISDAYKDMTAFLQLDDGVESVVITISDILRYPMGLLDSFLSRSKTESSKRNP